MQKELPTAYDPKATEDRIYKMWLDGGYFNPDSNPKRYTLNAEPYSIHLPPPNITGSLHMGHALNATISDILIRYHRMKGYKTVWFPGIDHAGIAAQNVVEKQLKKEGTSRWELGREKFVARVWEWKEKSGGIILEQLKKLGASLDWSRLRFTLDENYAEAVKKTFLHYYKKGWIYRGKRVVNWCPRCQTSLSDLEVEYKEEATKLYYFKYPVVAPTPKGRSGDYITVATTRPETMLGDAAVAVNPKDERYKKLVGQKVLLPIVNREIPIVADIGVDLNFGTGAVKVTPAHDLLDYEIGQRHKLPFYQVIDERAKMTELAGKEFVGLKTKEAREKVVVEMGRLDLVEKVEDYKHNLAVCSRCDSALEPLLSDQWFLKMEELAKKTLQALKKKDVEILPENFSKVSYAWLENIKDWCISRQIWWGHKIPIEGSEDVLDTWFSSALWPFAGLSEKDLENYYPSNVLITARDIINLWVVRMIFSGLEFQKAVPFPQVLIHATVLNKEGKRMSKSLGTGVDPMDLIAKYGADATRFGIIWQAMGTQDIHWDEAAVQAGKKFANKLWNISRFVLGRIENPKSQIPNSKEISKFNLRKEDEEILKKLQNTKEQVEGDIQNYDFGHALHTAYDFIWHELADKYIEAVKNRSDEEAQKVLLFILVSVLKLLHPFMPHLTEEVYGFLPLENKQALIVEEW